MFGYTKIKELEKRDFRSINTTLNHRVTRSGGILLHTHSHKETKLDTIKDDNSWSFGYVGSTTWGKWGPTDYTARKIKNTIHHT